MPRAKARSRSKAPRDGKSLGFKVVDGWDWDNDGNVRPMPKGGKREPLPPAKRQREDYERERLLRMYKALPFEEFKKDRRKLGLSTDTAKYDKTFAKAYAWLLPGLVEELEEGQYAKMTDAQYAKMKKYLSEQKKQPDTVRHVIHLLTEIHRALKGKEA